MIIGRRVQRIEVLSSLRKRIGTNDNPTKGISRRQIRDPRSSGEIEPRSCISRRLIECRAVIDAGAVVRVDVGADAIAETLIDVDARRVAGEAGEVLDRAFLKEIRKAGVHAGVVHLAAHVEVGVAVPRRRNDLIDRIAHDRPRGRLKNADQIVAARCAGNSIVAQEELGRQREVFARVIDALNFLVPGDVAAAARCATNHILAAEILAAWIESERTVRCERECALDVAGAALRANANIHP